MRQAYLIVFMAQKKFVSSSKFSASEMTFGSIDKQKQGPYEQEKS